MAHGEDMMTEYRLILVQRKSDGVLGIATVDGYRLPRVAIPASARRTISLLKAVRDIWQSNVLILDFFVGTVRYATAELLSYIPGTTLIEISLDQLAFGELTAEALHWCRSSLDGATESPFTQAGWIDQAITWLATATHEERTFQWTIEQYNAGGQFSLVKLEDENASYWMKATGSPNQHEGAVTCYLATLASQALPRILDWKPEWNAWLMAGGATSLMEGSADFRDLFPTLSTAVESMAALQIRTMEHERELLTAGAFHHSVEILGSHSETLFDYLEEAMSHQTSNVVPRIQRPRLQKIREIFDRTCVWMSELRIPDAIVHGDLNLGNILKSPSGCSFIDWAEALVGNPLISLEHLLLLNPERNGETKRADDRSLRDRYKQAMREVCSPYVLDKAFLASPLIAAVSALHGRGDWLLGSDRHEQGRQHYARTLARQMDRAASDPQLLSTLGG